MPDQITLRHFAAGTATSCRECSSAGYATADAGFFSWSQCSGCHSPLGGMRYAAHAVFTDHSYEHLNICTDCLDAMAGTDPEGRMDALTERYAQPTQTGHVWFYHWNGRELIPDGLMKPNVSYDEYAAMSLRPSEVARFDTSNFDPHTEYHDEWTADEDRTVLYRRGAEPPQPWPVGLPYTGCQCSICGANEPPATVLPEPPTAA